MNPLEVLLPALYAALATVPMTSAGASVPVYNPVAKDKPAGAYVVITQPTDNPAGGATGCRQFACTVLLDVVTQFADPRTVTTTLAEAIVSQVHARLRGQRLVLPAGWDCGPGEGSVNQLEELPEKGELLRVRRLVRYRWTVYYTP